MTIAELTDIRKKIVENISRLNPSIPRMKTELHKHVDQSQCHTKEQKEAFSLAC